jgi:hypothetical protein
MDSHEVVKRLPDMIAEAENTRGSILTDAEVGDFLIQIGESIKSGDYAKVGLLAFAAHDPACTSTPKKTASSDVLCSC